MTGGREKKQNVLVAGGGIGDYWYHPAGEARKVRNAVLGSMTVDEMYDGFEWIYGGNGLPARARAAARGGQRAEGGT